MIHTATQQLVSIGIDIAKEKFDAALLYTGRAHEIDTYENNASGVRNFIRRLQKQRTACAVPCVLESTGLLHLTAALEMRQAGYRVHLINPLITKKYQRASIRNAKTDSIDALRLAEIGLKEEQLPIFSGNMQGIEARKLISYLGTLEHTKQKIVASMKQVEFMQEVTGTQIDLRPTRRALKAIEQQCAALQRRICALAPQAAKELADATPGLSEEKAAVIFAALGDKRFEHRDQLVSFVGLDVMPRQSGTWRGKGKLSKRGNAYLRKTLYHIAWGLKQHNEKFKNEYNRLRAAGKQYVTTLIILARKFLRFLFAYYWKKNSYPQVEV